MVILEVTQLLKMALALREIENNFIRHSLFYNDYVA
jgi:hypothetical protein